MVSKSSLVPDLLGLRVLVQKTQKSNYYENRCMLVLMANTVHC